MAANFEMLPVGSAALLIVGDYSRSRVAHFKLLVHFLDLRGLLFESNGRYHRPGHARPLSRRRGVLCAGRTLEGPPSLDIGPPWRHSRERLRTVQQPSLTPLE
jgi:hypothetical protein